VLPWQRTSRPSETEAVGAALAVGLAPGDAVLVSGELGAGKTTLIRGACRALGVEGPVVSPTFTIGRRYAGSVPVSHLDLFRLEGLGPEEPGLLDDYLTPDGITFIEWPAAMEPELPGETGALVRVEIRHLGGDEREIAIGDREAPA
jgi:tRNA threonylcarbamoyladenosine biosynthesis protein TsaE